MPLIQPLEREVVAQRLHHAIELADVRGLVSHRSHEEAPVAGLQLGGAELQRAHLDVRVLLLALVELVRGRQQQHVGECAGLRAEGLLQRLHLCGLAVRRDHRRELRSVVHRRAVVEDDRRERVREDVDVRDGQRGHLRDRAERVALAAALDAEEADGVRLVQVDRDAPA
jgi:hypothetical protein